MGNPEHAAILERGVAEWNAWRHRHPEIVPDLSDLGQDAGMSLRGRDLSNADFVRAQLLGTDLTGANLSYAKFVAATLQSAHLSGTNLY